MNLTAADFSLEGRALSVGGNVVYNGVVPVDEAVEANGTTLTVMQTPVAPLGGCNVVGYINNGGTAYPIDPDTKQIQGFTAVAGTTYCVHYYTTNPSAKQLSIETLMNPAVVRGFITILSTLLRQRLQRQYRLPCGSLYITIPRGQLAGDASTEGSQTTRRHHRHELDRSVLRRGRVSRGIHVRRLLLSQTGLHGTGAVRQPRPERGELGYRGRQRYHCHRRFSLHYPCKV